MKPIRPPDHTPGGEALTELLLAVFRLNGRVLASGERLVADLGLTGARWQVMGAIALAGAPLPVAHIARNMGLTRQAVQRVVNELASDGLVSFAPNPYHRRAKLVRLTAAGMATYQAADERQKPWANQLAAGLDERDIKRATDVARALIQRLEAAVEQAPDETPEDDPSVT